MVGLKITKHISHKDEPNSTGRFSSIFKIFINII